MYGGVNDAVAKLLCPTLWDGTARPAASDTILHTCPYNFILIEGLSGMMTTYDEQLIFLSHIFFVLNDGSSLGMEEGNFLISLSNRLG